MVLDTTLFKIGSQMVFQNAFAYISYIFTSQYNRVWITNMETGLDPRNSVINSQLSMCSELIFSWLSVWVSPSLSLVAPEPVAVSSCICPSLPGQGTAWAWACFPGLAFSQSGNRISLWLNELQYMYMYEFENIPSPVFLLQLYPASVAAQACLSLPLSRTPKTGFLVMRHTNQGSTQVPVAKWLLLLTWIMASQVWVWQWQDSFKTHKALHSTLPQS